jgi:hypothetical protein
MVMPEFVAELEAPLQRLFPPEFRVVDLSAAVGAQAVRKAIDLDFALSALGGLCRLALGHSPPDIRGGTNTSPGVGVV